MTHAYQALRFAITTGIFQDTSSVPQKLSSDLQSPKMPLKPAISALARQTLKTAYDELDRTITPGDKHDFGNTTLQHVRKAALDIENQLAARGSLRNTSRLMPLFQGLEHYSEVVKILCNGTPYLSWVWAPITLILRIACEYVEAFEKIIKGHASIAESLKRFEILSDAFIREPEFQRTLAVFYADILKFHKHAYKFVRRSGWQLIFLTSWGRFERKFNNILEDLKQHGDLIDKEANARNVAEAKKMREDIRSANQFEAIASWLKINESDQLAIFDSISSEVAEHQGTCAWISKNPKVRSWFQRKPDTPALWLQGSAGTGKSVLCTQLVNFMKASDMFVIHHFCTYVYASSTAYDQILKSLILQLVRKDGDLVAHVYEAHVLEKKSPTTTALEQLFQTLLTIMSDQPSQEDYAWVIIDGLDECEQDKQVRLIGLINKVTAKPSLPGTTVCKVLIASRSPSNALQSLRRKQIVSLTEEKASLQGAIGQYVGERLRSLDTRLRQLDIGQTEVGEIQAVIVTKADGMFLYARLVMDYLASNIFYNGDEIKQSVNQLPKKLAEFYDKILTQILVQLDSRSIDRIRCILGWVAFAKRPLQKLEFLSAVTFSPGDPGVDRLVPQYILDICGTLIEERRNSTLAFIHISVKEYLQGSSSNMVIEKQEALHEHGVAAITCLLSGLRLFRNEFHEQERLLRVVKGLHGFHVYATEYWTEYLLSHAAGTDGSTIASPTPLITLACQLADEMENSKRLAPLEQYPTLHKHVGRALRARSLKNLEARILEGYGTTRASTTLQPQSERRFARLDLNVLDLTLRIPWWPRELMLLRAAHSHNHKNDQIFPWMTPESDGDDQRQSIDLQPWLFPPIQTEPMEPSRNTREQSIITLSSGSENQYHRTLGMSAFEQQLHERSPPQMKTANGPSGASPGDQESPSHWRPEDPSAESVPFRAMVDLSVEEMDLRGELFHEYLYKNYTDGTVKLCEVGGCGGLWSLFGG
ncbi:hypothetical protein CEP52_017550 [Fusarium oligoseptatum]|uniref:NACHT domain-containing protein n=1 Tax=Fusarium oligoseptatum TaxID=2604345 RepID=A0A428RNU7_9HYPO|nr:hypothetical protein CEP52_017550 [Fusarium oligoseptatum]